MIMVRFAYLVLLWVLASTSRAASEFRCGNSVCERRGFVACIGSGLDAYCLQCTDRRAKCGTTLQLPGCNLFCQELIRNQTIRELEVRESKINDSFMGEITDYEEELAQMQFIFHLVSIVMGTALVFCLLVILALLLCPKWRQKCQQLLPQCENGEIIMHGNPDEADEEEKQDKQEDETCRLVIDDQPQHGVNAKPTRPQECQTEEPFTIASVEAACQTHLYLTNTGTVCTQTQTDLYLTNTGTVCTQTQDQGDPSQEARPKFNNIPPTDTSNHDVVLQMPKQVHPGVHRGR